MNKVFFLSVSAILLGAGCVAPTSPRAPAEAPPSPQASVPSSVPPSIAQEAVSESVVGKNYLGVLKNQKPGKEVLINRVWVTKKGFVVLHTDENGAAGKILANSSLLNAGETRDVPVRFQVQPGVTYWAMLHIDNGNGKFSAADDTPAKDEKEIPVTASFTVEGARTSPATPSTEVILPTAAKPQSPPALATEEKKLSKTSVLIKTFSFTPSTVTIKKGDSILFTNADFVGHTVTADGGAFGSALMAQNGIFTLETSRLSPGAYPYHCTPHPFMKGTIIVQ